MSKCSLQLKNRKVTPARIWKFSTILKNCLREFQNSPPVGKIHSENSKILHHSQNIWARISKLAGKNSEICKQEFRISLPLSKIVSKNSQILCHSWKSPAGIPKFSASVENCQQEFPNSPRESWNSLQISKIASKNPKILRHSRN